MRLEADRVGLPVQPPGLAGDSAVEVVAGIALQAGLRGRKLERAPRHRSFEVRHGPELAVQLEAEGGVIALAVAQLRVAVPDPLADRNGGSKVEGCADHAVL